MVNLLHMCISSISLYNLENRISIHFAWAKFLPWISTRQKYYRASFAHLLDDRNLDIRDLDPRETQSKISQRPAVKNADEDVWRFPGHVNGVNANAPVRSSHLIPLSTTITNNEILMASRDSVNSHVSCDPDARMDKKKNFLVLHRKTHFVPTFLSLRIYLFFLRERIMARITDNNLRNLCESSETAIVST